MSKRVMKVAESGQRDRSMDEWEGVGVSRSTE